jgi:hypothetical protein
MTKSSNTYWVTFSPEDNDVVTGITVVDSWSSSGSLAEARWTMKEAIKAGHYKHLGHGRLEVVKTYVRLNCVNI